MLTKQPPIFRGEIKKDSYAFFLNDITVSVNLTGYDVRPRFYQPPGMPESHGWFYTKIPYVRVKVEGDINTARNIAPEADFLDEKEFERITPLSTVRRLDRVHSLSAIYYKEEGDTDDEILATAENHFRAVRDALFLYYWDIGQSGQAKELTRLLREEFFSKTYAVGKETHTAAEQKMGKINFLRIDQNIVEYAVNGYKYSIRFRVDDNNYAKDFYNKAREIVGDVSDEEVIEIVGITVDKPIPSASVRTIGEAVNPIPSVSPTLEGLVTV